MIWSFELLLEWLLVLYLSGQIRSADRHVRVPHAQCLLGRFFCFLFATATAASEEKESSFFGHTWAHGHMDRTLRYVLTALHCLTYILLHSIRDPPDPLPSPITVRHHTTPLLFYCFYYFIYFEYEKFYYSSPRNGRQQEHPSTSENAQSPGSECLHEMSRCKIKG